MAEDTRADGGELHDTVQAEPDDGLPPAVADSLPEKYQDYTLADDAMDATVQSGSTETVVLADDVNESLYAVEMDDITWSQANEALTNNLKRTEDGGGKLDFAGYYREVAKLKISSVEPEPDNLTTWLAGLNSRVGKQLEHHLPEPFEDLEEGEEKN